MRKLILLVALVMAACGSFGVPQAHAITLAYKTGDAYSYHFHAVLNYTVGISTMTIPVIADVAADEKMTVKSVDSSGTADLDVKLTNLAVKVTANGTTNTTTKDTATSIEMKVGSDGHVISVNGNAISGSPSIPGIPGTQGGLLSAILPDKAVKPGDTWTKSFDVTPPAGSGSIHVASTNKYARDERVGSVNAAVVQSNINTTINLSLNTSASGQGGASLFPSTGSSGLQSFTIKGTDASIVTSWVDTSAKRILKTHQTDTLDLTIAFTMAPGSTPGVMLNGPITLKGTQTLDMTPA